jgi:hypothetical protein
MLLYAVRVVSLCIALLLCAAKVTAVTWYVAPNAQGTGDGTSLANAAATINKVWLKATAGDVIELANGTYAGETLGRRSSSANWATNVTIRSTAGQTATISGTLDVESGVGHVTFDRLAINGRISLRSVYGNFVIQNSEFYGNPNAYMVDAALRLTTSNVLVKNNSFHDYYGADAITVAANKGDPTRSKFVTIDRNVIQNFYDNVEDASDNIHEDGIQFYDTEDLTITNNIINRVSNSSIINSVGSGTGIARVRIENNFLRKMDGENGVNGFGVLNLLYDDGKISDIKVINNTILSDIHVANSAEILLRNNIVDRYQVMGALVQRDHNLVNSLKSGITLTETEVQSILPLFVDPLNGDLHIANGNLVNLKFGSWALAPVTDFDGQQRYDLMWVGADQPLPEPSTALFCVAGSMLLLRRRSRQAAAGATAGR